MGRIGGGAASRRYRRYEEFVFPGVDSHTARHARGGRAAEGGRGAAPNHDAGRGDACARGARSAAVAAQVPAESPARWAAGVTPAPSGPERKYAQRIFSK